ncbi:MAG: cupin domain-containing protein [Solirubrobacteraceae bacterium]
MPNVHVVDAAEVRPRINPDGVLSVRPTVGPQTGFPALEQAVLECAPGRSDPIRLTDPEETLFVLSGRGTVEVGEQSHQLEPEVGISLGPGTEFRLHNPGPDVLRLVAVRVPEPEPAPDDAPAGATVRRLADQESEAASTQREFRIVADPDSGLRSATHFVGYIPTLRAPEHFHTYDEVIYVLDGEGVMHAEGMARPLGAGSCIQLPARTVHCLENTGAEPMRVLGVFRPAGSPAAAYYPDGRPAYPAGDDQRRATPEEE